MLKPPKPATSDVVTCPLCQGHGKLDRAGVVIRLNDEEFNRTLQNYIDEVTYGPMELRDPMTAERDIVTVVHGDQKSGNAHKKFGA